MTQYNFTTNIEKRMPTTGEVFFVDRMTSDYAVQHPFDVDAFIESVFQKWQDCETVGFRETRETLRRQWEATLGERNPRGNAAIYPNKSGEKHPALMEVWHKAGDYWRRGLRLGDVLPAVVPPCRITRTEEGWIALFPKDMHLLGNEECRVKSEELSEQSATLQQVDTEEGTHQPDPRDEELAALRQQLADLQQQMAEEHARYAATQAPAPSVCPSVQPQEEEAPLGEYERQREYVTLMTERKRQRLEHEAEERRQREERMASEEQDRQQRKAKKHGLLKAVGLFAASVVACVVIYETGFLIPLGLIGLGTSGLVK